MATAEIENIQSAQQKKNKQNISLRPLGKPINLIWRVVMDKTLGNITSKYT